MLNHGAKVTLNPEHPKLGQFLCATCKFKSGEVILQEPPFLKVAFDQDGLLNEDVVANTSALHEIDLFVPVGGDEREQELLEELEEMYADQGAEALYVHKVLHFNSFHGSGEGDHSGEGKRVLFATIARANHSCAPNCVMDAETGVLRAIKDVVEGEELTISYLSDLSLLSPRDQRRYELDGHWGFKCCCVRCAADTDDVRRFKACQEDGCEGELLAMNLPEESEGVLMMPCVCWARDGSVPPMPIVQEVLAEEEEAFAGLFDREDEDAWTRTCTFAAKHPTHAIAVRLAHDAQFPDAVQAQRSLLNGLSIVYGNAPCKLKIDVRYVLAELLEAQGDNADAELARREAKEMALFLCLD